MKIDKFRYFAREASKDVFANGWMSLASVFTVLASLLVFGFFLVLTVNLNYIATQLEGDYEIIVVVDEYYDKDQVKAIGKDLKAIENIKDVSLSTKEERLEGWKEQLGAQLLEGYEEDNPLRDWYLITLSDLSIADDTVSSIENIEGVAKIIRNQDTIDKLVLMTNYLGTVSVWVMIALALISVFIISNTIKLTVFARHKEINIMKYVGATDWFIRWPFIIEGVIIGLIGAIISFIIVGYGYRGILGLVSALDIAFVTFKPFSAIVWPLIGAFLGLGVVLGGIGSLVAVRKHLKV